MIKNSYFEGIKVGLGILSVFLVLFGLVYAAGYHYANEIVPGAFQDGDYSFNGGISIGGSPTTYNKLIVDNPHNMTSMYTNLDQKHSILVRNSNASIDNSFSSIGFAVRTSGPTSNAAIAAFSINPGESDLAFYNELGNIAYERMRITSLGNIGIGTTNPQAKLDVAGSIRAGSNLENGRIHTIQYIDFSGNVPKKLLGWDDNKLAYGQSALVFCAITGTSSSGTSLWMIKQHESASATNSYIEKIASFGSIGSNTPELFVDSEYDISIRMYTHTSGYNIECTMIEIG